MTWQNLFKPICIATLKAAAFSLKTKPTAHSFASNTIILISLQANTTAL
jgi:hypothetical protein